MHSFITPNADFIVLLHIIRLIPGWERGSFYDAGHFRYTSCGRVGRISVPRDNQPRTMTASEYVLSPVQSLERSHPNFSPIDPRTFSETSEIKTITRVNMKCGLRIQTKPVWVG